MPTDTQRQMTLVAFLQAANCSNLPASWRHPATEPGFLTAGYYQKIARTLEDGRFHLAFFDDRLAMPDIYGDDFRESVRHGARVVKLDLIPLLTAMGLATEHLGLGGTYSTTYYEPYHVARTFATLDHMTAGRAAWNVVTSINDSEAANFGVGAHLAHDARYDRADEFLKVVLGHWDTWEDGAIVLDREQGMFADPDKVYPLEHAGEWFRSRGPFTVPRTPQGHPVLIQAGQSGRGRAFAAQWGELIFVILPNLEAGRAFYRDVKDQAAALGRNPDDLKIAQAIYAIVGETEEIAREKAEFIDGLVQPVDTLALLSEVLNHDLSEHALDEPFTDEEIRSISGLRGVLDRIVQQSGKKNPTLADFVKFSGRGTLRELPTFVGTPAQVADGMEEWFTGEACDGFVVAATHMPGAYDDFVRLVVPELQRRGTFQTNYRGRTLRDNLGLERPERQAWRRLGRKPR